MKESLREWFVESQVVIAATLCILCLIAILIAGDQRIPLLVIMSVVSLVMIIVGKRLFVLDTSENWLTTSWSALIRNIVASIFMLFGWVILLRAVVGLAIGSLLLKAG